MPGTCFVCKQFSEKCKPIGLARLGCKEIHLCPRCNKEMSPQVVVKKPVHVSKPWSFLRYLGLTKSIH